MLVLAAQRLVILEAPKTASLALRAMLAPYVDASLSAGPRHVSAPQYRQHHAAALARSLGAAPVTLAVMREPLRRMQSWYRYRQRVQLYGSPASTRDISFEAFIAAYLQKDPPAFARLGRQDRFLGWDGQTAQVDLLFDYRQLDLMTAFLATRLGQDLRLAQRNVTRAADLDYSLSDVLLARFLRQHAAEFTLYRLLRQAGVLGLPAQAA